MCVCVSACFGGVQCVAVNHTTVLDRPTTPWFKGSILVCLTRWMEKKVFDKANSSLKEALGQQNNRDPILASDH